MARIKKRFPPVILATCVIPWDSQFRFIENLFRGQVCLLAKSLTRHMYIFGTAGEGYAVRDSQFRQIAQVFKEEADRHEVAPMLGIISLSLPTIVERIEFGIQSGFHSFQISLPCWGALTDRELGVFFKETCGRFPECRFLHYNLPRTKRVLTGDEYARLSAEHPNLVAVKTGGDEEYLVDLFAKAPELQIFPGGPTYARVRDRYECGLLISLAGTNFSKAKEFFNARGDRLEDLGGALGRILDALKRAVGPPAHIDGAFDKMLYKLHDPEFPLRLLPPYESSTEEAFEKFRSQMPAEWRPGQ